MINMLQYEGTLVEFDTLLLFDGHMSAQTPSATHHLPYSLQPHFIHVMPHHSPHQQRWLRLLIDAGQEVTPVAAQCCCCVQYSLTVQ